MDRIEKDEVRWHGGVKALQGYVMMTRYNGVMTSYVLLLNT